MQTVRKSAFGWLRAPLAALCAVFCTEVLLTTLIRPSEAAASDLTVGLVNASILGLVVAALFLFAPASWFGASRPTRRTTRWIAMGVVMGVTFAFEATLHAAVDTMAATLTPALRSLTHASAIALLIAILVAWFAFVEKCIDDQNTSGERSNGGIAQPLMLGAVFAAVCVSALPTITLFNTAQEWRQNNDFVALLQLSAEEKALNDRLTVWSDSARAQRSDSAAPGSKRALRLQRPEERDAHWPGARSRRARPWSGHRPPGWTPRSPRLRGPRARRPCAMARRCPTAEPAHCQTRPSADR
jgi:hypothetical protein